MELKKLKNGTEINNKLNQRNLKNGTKINKRSKKWNQKK
jgi:hypothetical protein